MSKNLRSAIDLSAWIEKARNDPIKYKQRQLTDIVLTAIALTPSLCSNLYLKGGTLMNIAFDSPRSTSDIDFTTCEDPKSFAERIESDLNAALRRAAAHLGYPLVCRVQTLRRRPRPESFLDAQFPALQMKIAFAQKGSREELRLEQGVASQTLPIEVSFHEPVFALDVIALTGVNRKIKSYSLTEVIAEKLRAFLQQRLRNRSRRQDIFDLAFLIRKFPLDEEEKSETLTIFIEKCLSRGIQPNHDSIYDPELSRRAQSEWNSMQQELDQPLPRYEDQFKIVADFYKELPW